MEGEVRSSAFILFMFSCRMACHVSSSHDVSNANRCFVCPWYSPKYEKEFGCRKQLMDEKYPSKHPIRKDSDTWKLLLEQNRFDVHLYEFAKELFTQQSYIFGL
jgi:hypothetical protein